MLSEFTVEEYHAALEDVAGEALRRAGVRRPPVDALLVATQLHLVVALDRAQAGRARRVRIGSGGSPQGVILVRDEPRPERRQWSVAHEIGEHLAAGVFQRLSVDPRETPGGTREQVANALASRLLLPGGWFERAAAACDWDLPTLKRRFATASHELIARRMLDFPPRAIVSIFDHGRLTFRRGNLSHGTPALSPCEHDCWRTTHLTGEPTALPSDEPRVRAWPIHEPGWKREILRTAIVAD